MLDIPSLSPLYDLAYPGEENSFVEPSLLQSPIDYERIAPQGFKGLNVNRGLNAYDASYIFCEGIVTLEGMPAMFPSSCSPIKGSS
jgi:hypothetical protein